MITHYELNDDEAEFCDEILIEAVAKARDAILAARPGDEYEADGEVRMRMIGALENLSMHDPVFYWECDEEEDKSC